MINPNEKRKIEFSKQTTVFFLISTPRLLNFETVKCGLF